MGSTIGIWLPFLYNYICNLDSYELKDVNLSICMYAVPMIYSVCSDMVVFAELTKKQRSLYQSILVIMSFISLIHILLIYNNWPMCSTIMSVIQIIGVMVFYWYQLSEDKFEEHDSPLGGKV